MLIEDEIIFNTSLGNIKIVSKKEEVVSIDFTEHKIKHSNSLILNKSKNQIEDYLSGRRTIFDILINPHGTNFQKSMEAIISYTLWHNYILFEIICFT